MDYLRLTDEGVAYKSSSDYILNYLYHSKNITDQEKLAIINHLKVISTYNTLLETIISKQEKAKLGLETYREEMLKELRRGGYFSHNEIIDVVSEVLAEISNKIDESNSSDKLRMKNAIIKGMAKTIHKFNELRPSKENRE